MSRNTESTPSHFKTNKIKHCYFWCLLLVISLVVMELCSFAIIKLSTKKGPYRNRVEQVLNPFHPYLGYVHAPNVTFKMSKGLSRKMIVATDENGYSITPSFSFVNPDITIIITGGSTIFGVGSSDNTTTVPSVLERLINERLDVKAEVVNLALRGCQSFQEMLLVNRFFAENQADLVLAVSGRNDADYAYVEQTVEGAFLSQHVWDNAVSLVHKAERGEFMLINLENGLRSWLYTYDLLYRMVKPLRKGKKFRQPAEPSKFDIKREASTNINQRAKITATHYAAIEQITKTNGATFVMFLQPTLYTKDTWTDEEMRRLKRKRWSDEFKERRQNEHKFYNSFRKAKKPFHFIDLSYVFAESDETLYIDQCHYNDVAAEKLAEKIFESIQPFLNKS